MSQGWLGQDSEIIKKPDDFLEKIYRHTSNKMVNYERGEFIQMINVNMLVHVKTKLVEQYVSAKTLQVKIKFNCHLANTVDSRYLELAYLE